MSIKKIKQIPHLQFPHTQVIKFDNGETRTIRNVTSVESGKWEHIFCTNDGHGAKEFIINTSRILYVQILDNNEEVEK